MLVEENIANHIKRLDKTHSEGQICTREINDDSITRG